MPRYAALIYNGFWFSPEREMLQALIDKSQEFVAGSVRLKLYKGNVAVVGRDRRLIRSTAKAWSPSRTTRAPMTRRTRRASSSSMPCGCARSAMRKRQSAEEVTAEPEPRSITGTVRPESDGPNIRAKWTAIWRIPRGGAQACRCPARRARAGYRLRRRRDQPDAGGCCRAGRACDGRGCVPADAGTGALAGADQEYPNSSRPMPRSIPFEPEFDLIFSRFGVMFFADPVAAFANIRKARGPGRAAGLYLLAAGEGK